MRIRCFENTIWQSNTWLLSQPGETACYWVDCGDMEPLRELMKQENLALKGIFLTHTHFDHIYGLNHVFACWPQVAVYTSEAGKAGLGAPERNLSRYTAGEFVFQHPETVKILREGERVELWPGRELSVLETPGHDPSCLSYQVGNHIFTGDSYIPNAKVVAKLPFSNRVEAALSWERLNELAGHHSIYPGHDVCKN